MTEHSDHAPSAEYLIEAGKWLFAQECQFERGVVRLDDLPVSTVAEIGFVGRSNVGKSSLLNAVTRRKNLARTSNTPGRTQELNFFMLAPQHQALRLVDLPGYGYARESKSKIIAWNRLIFDYLRGRANLRRVFVLIDSRHGIKKNDIECLEQLDMAAVVYQIILTKADKISAAAQQACLHETAQFLAKRPAAFPEIILTSSETGLGINDVRASIATLVDLPAIGYKGNGDNKGER